MAGQRNAFPLGEKDRGEHGVADVAVGHRHLGGKSLDIEIACSRVR
jgi:hypothetical protein